MSKIKYKFNPETLSYQRIELSLRKRIIRLLPQAASALVFAIAGILIYTNVVDSPKERQLKRENQQLLNQYEILNRKLDQVGKVLVDLQYRDDNIYRTIFEAEPVPYTMRNAGIGGVNRYKELEGYDYSELVMLTSKKLDRLMKQVVVQSKSFDEVVRLARDKEKWLACIPAIQPILNKELNALTSHFGYRFDPVYKGTTKMHEGIDLTASVGTDVYATGDGVVKDVEFSGRGYGNQITINHGYGYTTRYAHLSRIDVQPGQKIKRGDIIGGVGNTGKSVGPHLHYEVRKNGTPLNPVNFFYQDLSPEEYDRMIEMSAQEGGQALD